MNLAHRQKYFDDLFTKIGMKFCIQLSRKKSPAVLAYNMYIFLLLTRLIMVLYVADYDGNSC